jgi:hypothetical protein
VKVPVEVAIIHGDLDRLAVAVERLHQEAIPRVCGRLEELGFKLEELVEHQKRSWWRLACWSPFVALWRRRARR